MKIMKAVDKKVGDVIYYKYKINLPKKVEETNLINKELKVSIEKDKIIIECIVNSTGLNLIKKLS